MSPNGRFVAVTATSGSTCGPPRAISTGLSLCFDPYENDRAELRYDHLEIYAGGELMRTLEVRQQAPAPAIATNFTEKQVAASAASFDVLVTCNAEWRAEVSPEDEAWLSLGERTATRLNVVCAVNDTGASREGAVRLYIPGTACEVSLAVKQSNN